MKKVKVLVTGAAGFIGYHLVKRLVIDSKYSVVGIDNLNDYYDVDLKYSRLKSLGIDVHKAGIEKYSISKDYNNLFFCKLDITDASSLEELFNSNDFSIVINLAAQAGVRYSVQFPHSYVENNIKGFLNILECSRKYQIKHLIYASSSSVYGLNNVPFSESDSVDHPISMYAVSKRTNELMAHTYSNMYNLPVTGLRFFTVYGPYCRPDMAPILFANAISKGETINLFNHGLLQRDFTYVTDITESIYKLIPLAPLDKKLNKGEISSVKYGPNNAHAPFRILNIGNDNPINVIYFIELLEKAIQKKAIVKKIPMQEGDVKSTWANIDRLEALIQYKPQTSIEEGVKMFIEWYINYYND